RISSHRSRDSSLRSEWQEIFLSPHVRGEGDKHHQRRPTMQLEKLFYTAKATSTGGRDGRAVTSDGQLDVKLAKPVEMGGDGAGLNPEQLFAAGYSACFLGAMKFVAAQDNLVVPDDASIEG